MVFLNQIQVCYAGSELMHGWRISFFVVGALLVGINLFSLEGHAFHGVDSLVCFVEFLLCFRCLPHRRVSLPGGHQVDGSPPAPSNATRKKLGNGRAELFMANGCSNDTCSVSKHHI